MNAVRKEIFVASPGDGVDIAGYAIYTQPEGRTMMSVHGVHTRSDILDAMQLRFSDDNGRTWSPGTPFRTYAKRPEGTLQRWLQPGFLDARTGGLVFFILHGVLPTDDPLDGLKYYTMRWTISNDGGRTLAHEEPVIQDGPQYDERHPIDGVWLGRNAIMEGVNAVVLESGEALYPVMVAPLGPDGQYHNPTKAYTFTDVVVLIGRWDGDRLRWGVSQRIRIDPGKSTRGALEPAITPLADGRLLIVMRGSNDTQPDLPGRKWYTISSDRGRTWSEPQPWTFDDGQAFFSPSSISRFVNHSSGRIFWLGNIVDRNPTGNLPRRPLIAGQVDPRTGLLIRSTVTILEAGEDDSAMLTNFHAHEDRQTSQINLYLPYWHYPPKPGCPGHLWRYAIEV